MLVRSALALTGVRHAFSTREGGVSEGPWASLNLGRPVGDDGDRPEAVEENRRRFAAAAGFEPDHFAEVSQVHGTALVEVSGRWTRADAAVEADAVWTEQPGVAVAVRTADCAPVLLAAYRADRPVAVAAVHAGWRGACAGIVPAAVAALSGCGPAEHMRAAIGPTIGPDRFEVGEEVVEAAAKALGRPPKTTPGPRGRPLLDLPHLVEQQLLDAGLPPDHVDVLGLCTFNDPRFFSHRRDAGRTGRHLSVIQMEPRAWTRYAS